MELFGKAKVRYIRAIYELTRDGDTARVSDLAIKLGVTKPSVSNAVKSLERDRLVIRDVSRRVSLTPEGRQAAIKSAKRYTVILHFLTEVLHVDQKTAQRDSCAMEHAVSKATYLSMQRLKEKPL